MTDSIDTKEQVTLEDINKRLKELGKKREEIERKRNEEIDKRNEEIDRLNKEKKKVEAQQKVELERIERERREPWIQARIVIPQSTNKEKVEHLLAQLYQTMHWGAFDYIIYAQDPEVFNNYPLKDTDRSRRSELNRHTTLQREHDPWSGVSVGYFLDEIWKEEETDLSNLLNGLTIEIIDFIPKLRVPVVLEKPQEVHFNRDRRLHSLEGPAIIWRNGKREWWVNGVRATKKFVEEEVTLKYISTQTNAERKRILIERYGEERYLKDLNAKLIQEDAHGKLWEVIHRGWDIRNERFVEVTNSSPEPDGSFRKFFLKVPPSVRSAKEAVAWTFNKVPDEYQPSKET